MDPWIIKNIVWMMIFLIHSNFLINLKRNRRNDLVAHIYTNV